jgi:serine protease Do
MILSAVTATCFLGTALAQTPANPQPRKVSPPAKTAEPTPVATRATASQVVTVVHRLNGLKVFRLLLRWDTQVQAVTQIDQAFNLMDDVHTNVIAGLTLEDGQTVAAWLPEAEVEFATSGIAVPSPLAPLRPLAPSAAPPRAPLLARALSVAPELTVIGPNGKRWPAQYVGLDGATGLSILKLGAKNLPVTLLANDERIGIGETIRLFGPEPVTQPGAISNGSILVRIGETNGTVLKVNRTPAGGISRLRVSSPRLNVANVGGVALNEAGEAVGIVDGIDGTEASILPAGLIRRAAKRVLAQQSSVPKPWLGVEGEPVAKLRKEQITSLGWESEQASSLLSDHRGILLTWIAPGSPAALAALKPGDVILKVNDEDIQNGDDFSWHLEQSAPSESVQFTVARPDRMKYETVRVTLGELLNPRLLFRLKNQIPAMGSLSLITQGIETIALRPAVASQLGASGLLVVYVDPSTAAFEAGLQPGDVIQAIDGKPVMPFARAITLSNTPGKAHAFEIIRRKQKLVVAVANPDRNK